MPLKNESALSGWLRRSARARQCSHEAHRRSPIEHGRQRQVDFSKRFPLRQARVCWLQHQYASGSLSLYRSGTQFQVVGG